MSHLYWRKIASLLNNRRMHWKWKYNIIPFLDPGNGHIWNRLYLHPSFYLLFGMKSNKSKFWLVKSIYLCIIIHWYRLWLWYEYDGNNKKIFDDRFIDDIILIGMNFLSLRNELNTWTLDSDDKVLVHLLSYIVLLNSYQTLSCRHRKLFLITYKQQGMKL